MRLWRRKRKKIDTKQWPCIYVGPPSKVRGRHLQTNSPCRIIGTKGHSGLTHVATVDGSTWYVPKHCLVSSALKAAA